MKSWAFTGIGFLTFMASPLTIQPVLRCEFDDDGDVGGEDLVFMPNITEASTTCADKMTAAHRENLA